MSTRALKTYPAPRSVQMHRSFAGSLSSLRRSRRICVLIDDQVLRLRRKIEVDPSQPKFILTERGVGYLFNSPVEVLYRQLQHSSAFGIAVIADRRGYRQGAIVTRRGRTAIEAR